MAEIIELPKPPRMRGIRQAVAEIKKADPDSALTETALRKLIRSGTVPSVKAGCKYLVNLDTLCKYLSEGEQITPSATSNGIRRIAEK